MIEYIESKGTQDVPKTGSTERLKEKSKKCLTNLRLPDIINKLLQKSRQDLEN